MAGHSQFKNIMHRKGAQDAKKAKVFTKIIRELTVAAREGGPDVNTNPRLRAAMTGARESNMPKDTMERAIKRGAGHEEGTNYEEVRYEGYGPGGIAVIVEGLTDNRNRTASDVRSTFGKLGGNLGESGSVNFMFNRAGVLKFPVTAAKPDEMFEAALEAGADDVQSTEDGHIVICAHDALSTVRDDLTAKFGDGETKLTWLPQTETLVTGDVAKTLLRLIDTLEDNDDVQFVYTNAIFEDEEVE